MRHLWLAVFSEIGAFEGRSSLVTWVFSIVLNRAPARHAGGSPSWPADFDHWIEAPRLWDEMNPERIVGGRQFGIT